MVGVLLQYGRCLGHVACESDLVRICFANHDNSPIRLKRQPAPSIIFAAIEIGKHNPSPVWAEGCVQGTLRIEAGDCEIGIGEVYSLDIPRNSYPTVSLYCKSVSVQSVVVAYDASGNSPSASETSIKLPVFCISHQREHLAVSTIRKRVSCYDDVIVRVNGDRFRLIRISAKVCEYFAAAAKARIE